MRTQLLRIERVSKSFGPNKVLDNITLDIEPGQIYSLIGKNGAGKTTLVNIIYGLYKADSGRIFFEGIDITNSSLEHRQTRGIRIVTQHASIVPHMTVAENISIGLWPQKKNGLVDWSKLKKISTEVLKEYGIDLDPNALMEDLDTITHRKINIIRALFGGGKLIILDEPTTSLTSIDRNTLFEFIRNLAKRGVSFIFISHYLDEVMKLSDADNIIVIRDGHLIPIEKGEKITQLYLGRLMEGRDVSLTYRDRGIVDGDDNDILLSCENLCGEYLDHVSLKVKKGEIVGLIGFPNSGARELCRAIYGLDKITKGSIKLMGKEIKLRVPADALNNNIVYIPSDRHREGIVAIHSVKSNISLSILRKLRNRFKLVDRSKEHRIADTMKEQLNIKANTVEDLLNSLSGGNQQKVVVAKSFVCDPVCLLLDEPTVGIDIKSREEILRLINEKTRTGTCVLYYTNDFDELIRICDRFIFFENGKIKTTCNNDGLTSSDIVDIRDKKER